MRFSASLTGFVTLAVMIVFAFKSNCFSQEKYVIKHTQSGGDRGFFSAEYQGDETNNAKISVSEMTLSISGKENRKVYVSADVTVETSPVVPNDIKTSIKSYADPDFERKVEYKESEENSGEFEEQISDIKEDAVPTKLYLEVIVDGETSTYYFWDKNDLEPIISDLNGKYGCNLEVVRSGRSVSVRNGAFEKEIEETTLTKTLNATKSQLEDGSASAIFKFDVVKLGKELIADKIMPKDRADDFTLIIDVAEMYVNGNKISDKLLPKYRKIMGNFTIEFDGI